MKRQRHNPSRRLHRNPVGLLATAAMAGPVASWWYNALAGKKRKRAAWFHRNPGTNGKALPLSDGSRMPVEKFEQWLGQHGSAADKKQYDEAKKKYVNVHLGAAPKEVGYTKMDFDGDKKTKRIYMASMGKAPASYYTTPKDSGKEGKDFVHEWKSAPEVLVDAAGKHVIMPLRKGARVDRGWMRGN